MKQITEDYVNSEIAVLLKERGFDELCIKKYNKDGFLQNAGNKIEEWQNSELDKDEYSAPTLQTALKWLREMHNIFIEINVSIDLNGSHHFNYSILDKECKYIRKGHTSFDWNYEQAVEAAILYVLKNLI